MQIIASSSQKAQHEESACCKSRVMFYTKQMIDRMISSVWRRWLNLVITISLTQFRKIVVLQFMQDNF